MVAYERVDPSKLVKIQCLQQAVEEARKRMKDKEKMGFIDKEREQCLMF